jgi:repressor LexA
VTRTHAADNIRRMGARVQNLTTRQVDIVITLRNLSHLNGYMPSIRELCAVTGKARGTIVQHLRALERKGIIRRHAHKARAIEILQHHEAA